MMKTSTTIAVGHGCTESGCGIVAIYLDDERVAMSPKAARHIAAELLFWAEHAEAWQQTEEETRRQKWRHFVGDPIETEARWVAVLPEDEIPEASE